MRSIAHSWCVSLMATISLLLPSTVQAGAHLSEPVSRVVLCAQGKNNDCLIGWRKATMMASGKFFPAKASGLHDPIAPSDVQNALPPPDSRIAGTSVLGDLPFLNEQTPTRWEKVPLRSGAKQVFKWEYNAARPTRRWNYFITRVGWDEFEPLARSQFEEKPFCTIQNLGQPYWEFSANLIPPASTEHLCQLPTRRGYHVILAASELADSPMAFYQVVDVIFEDGTEDPSDLETEGTER